MLDVQKQGMSWIWPAAHGLLTPGNRMAYFLFFGFFFLNNFDFGRHYRLLILGIVNFTVEDDSACGWLLF